MPPFTDAAPMQAVPMQAVSTAIVAHQPTMEPAPRMQPDADDATMRGGGASCGLNCCHGHCSFHKSCC